MLLSPASTLARSKLHRLALDLGRSAILPVLIACSGSESDGLPEAVAPDIAGNYNFILEGTTGCDGEQGWLNDWAPGALVVEGAASGLSFDFGNEMVFVGSIDAGYSLQFGDRVDFGGASLAVFSGGAASHDGERWTLSGLLEATVDDDGVESNDCTIEGPYEALELVAP